MCSRFRRRRISPGAMPSLSRSRRYHDFFVDRVSQGERVLDIGSGKGELAFDLVTISGATVVGVDHDPGHVAFRAGAFFASPGLRFVEADVLEWLPRRSLRRGRDVECSRAPRRAASSFSDASSARHHLAGSSFSGARVLNETGLSLCATRSGSSRTGIAITQSSTLTKRSSPSFPMLGLGCGELFLRWGDLVRSAACGRKLD